MSDLPSSVEYVHRRFDKLSSTERAIEWLKCKTNPFYFIFNYAFIPEIGGVLKYEHSLMGGKIKRFVKSVFRYHKCLFMASRQLGKALSLDTPIPTPSGEYVLLKDLKIGDFVLDDKSQPTKIIGITGTMYGRPCFTIEFSTGEFIIADKNHLWKDKDNKLLTTNDIHLLFLSNKGFYINDKIHIVSISRKHNSVPVKCIQVENSDGIFLCGKTKIPTHNSTISACMLEWACNFYPYVPATILNANKGFALENIEKVKFIHNNLPTFLRTPLKYKGERKTTMEYKHGSIIRVFYPSSTTSATILARSLTAPILYVDECAHIRHMREAFLIQAPLYSDVY